MSTFLYISTQNVQTCLQRHRKLMVKSGVLAIFTQAKLNERAITSCCVTNINHHIMIMSIDPQSFSFIRPLEPVYCNKFAIIHIFVLMRIFRYWYLWKYIENINHKSIYEKCHGLIRREEQQQVTYE